MTLGHQKYKVTFFFNKIFDPDIPMQTKNKFTTQTSKRFVSDSILSNRKQSPNAIDNN